MMEGISAVESPMFDFVEQKNGRMKPAAPKEKQESEIKSEYIDEEPEFE